jgi:hypothetical protein
MSELETKRNALLNSVASSGGGGIELLDTITVETPTQNIDINVDTSTYKTFILKADLIYGGGASDYLYWGVNGTTTSSYFATQNNIAQVPGNTNHRSIIFAENENGNVSIFFESTQLNTLWENVNSLRLRMYGKQFTGGTVEVYGIKQSVITGE